jgi:hypothetical protein
VALLAHAPEVARAVTFSPLKDSLDSLARREGGDAPDDDALLARFVTPYLDFEASAELIVKACHTLVLTDDDGRSLDFTVSHLDMSEEGESDAEEGAEGQGEAAAPCALHSRV